MTIGINKTRCRAPRGRPCIPQSSYIKYTYTGECQRVNAVLACTVEGIPLVNDLVRNYQRPLKLLLSLLWGFHNDMPRFFPRS